ncbi:hypothetical protein FFA01_16090 [Frigoribacterium faeni]|uniref:Uncharacterized protein n=1 Tax=Frigoribacterium faeni TaxID=145483 RepID=A0ABQ0UP91_9MICO|nr:hypothetical protein GCM10025699_40950 [Microbacterium flavescens]GEK83300.1 hypothetical protein FFA01_16090 [Frigoribacterium faeni]
MRVRLPPGGEVHARDRLGIVADGGSDQHGTTLSPHARGTQDTPGASGTEPRSAEGTASIRGAARRTSGRIQNLGPHAERRATRTGGEKRRTP